MTWTSVGPTPQVNPEALARQSGDAEGNISGRANSLAFSNNVNRWLGAGAAPVAALFNGSSSGGVWITTAGAADHFEIGVNPAWRLTSPTIDGLRALLRDNVDIQRQVGINRTGAIAVDGTYPSSIYVGTGDPESRGGAGILWSTDGGNTWVLISDFSKGRSIAKILMDPTDSTGQRLYAAVVPQYTYDSLPSGGGVYLSQNAGFTWISQNEAGAQGNTEYFIPIVPAPSAPARSGAVAIQLRGSGLSNPSACR